MPKSGDFGYGHAARSSVRFPLKRLVGEVIWKPEIPGGDVAVV
jgi:hypothetical protein